LVVIIYIALAKLGISDIKEGGVGGLNVVI